MSDNTSTVFFNSVDKLGEMNLEKCEMSLVQLLLEKGVDPKEADLDGLDSFHLCLTKHSEWIHPHRSTTDKEMEKWALVWIQKKQTEIDGTPFIFG